MQNLAQCPIRGSMLKKCQLDSMYTYTLNEDLMYKPKYRQLGQGGICEIDCGIRLQFPNSQFPSSAGQVVPHVPCTWMGPSLASEFHLIAG